MSFLILWISLAGAQQVGHGPSFVLALSEEAARKIEEENGLVSDKEDICQ